MGLLPIPTVNPPYFSSLDQFIVKIHAGVLDALCSFAQRVIRSINSDPAALCWSVGGPLLITRDRWLHLCRRVVVVLRLLDLHGAASFPDWPGADQLADTTSRARGLYGPFAAQRWRRTGLPERLSLSSTAHALASAAAAAHWQA